MQALRRILTAIAAWGAMFACLEAAIWMSEVIYSDDAMRKLGSLGVLVVIAFFALWFGTICSGAIACRYTVPVRNANDSLLQTNFDENDELSEVASVAGQSSNGTWHFVRRLRLARLRLQNPR